MMTLGRLHKWRRARKEAKMAALESAEGLTEMMENNTIAEGKVELGSVKPSL